MGTVIALLGHAAKSLLTVAVLASALLGLLALVSPRAFAAVTAKGNQWVDTWQFFHVSENSLCRRLDKWIDLDHIAVRYSRLTGLLMLAGAVTLGLILYWT